MLNDEHVITRGQQATDYRQHGRALLRMQTRGRFVENIGHTEQGTVQLGSQAQALQLTGRQGGGDPVQAQMAEPKFQGGSQRRDNLGQQQGLCIILRSTGRRGRSSVGLVITDGVAIAAAGTLAKLLLAVHQRLVQKVQGPRIQLIDRHLEIAHL